MSSQAESSLDWSLPESFHPLLLLPLLEVIDTLLPATSLSRAPILVATPPPPAPFIEALKRQPDALTDNGALAYTSTGSPLVDLFFELTPGVNVSRLFNLLESAWEEDPLSTLRIIFHGRSIHEGKGMKEEVFRAVAWVWDFHPRTMLRNLQLFTSPTCIRHRSKKRDEAKRKRREDGYVVVDEEGNVGGEEEEEPDYPPRPHGSFKDLVDLLVLHINGQLTTSYTGPITAINEALAPAFQAHRFKAERLKSKVPGQKKSRTPYGSLSVKARRDKTDGIPAETFNEQILKSGSKIGKHRLLHDRLVLSLNSDKKFQALYCTVANIFVNQIRVDLALAKDDHDELPSSGIKGKANHSARDVFGLSYAAKWIPTPAHGADKQVHLATGIAMVLFPGCTVAEARKRLQRDVLTCLRKELKVPEIEMGPGKWTIDYSKVPARAMSRHAKSFMEHDPMGFKEYLRKVAEGRYSIAGASLMPHELLLDAMNTSQPVLSQLANLQWRSLVDAMINSSDCHFSNCLAVADVSGSMGSLHHGTIKRLPDPIAPCIALTLLMGELASPPWNGCFFTFSSNPTCEFIDPKLELSSRANSISQAHWEQSTALHKVFDLILATAKSQKLAPDDMVKTLFIFSDMQFDQCGGEKYGETQYQSAKRKFEMAGYTLPEIVFWNLAARFDESQPNTKPAQANVNGVSLVSGFSGALMKYFMGQAGKEETDEVIEVEPMESEPFLTDTGEEIMADGGNRMASLGRAKGKLTKTALETLKAIIEAESYNGIVVVD